jgi:sterol desaturase/sphingolipid hydroxylase (fatty acid hydroxylase superfamily)
MGTARGLGGAIATGVFLYLGAGEVTVYTAVGAHVAVTAFRIFGNLRHSMVWLSYGPLNHILVSPAMHQIHHSKLAKHFDRNCGWAFSFWDRLFGTIYVPKGRETFPLGLGDGSDGTWHGVGTMYVRPFVGVYNLLARKAPSVRSDI